MPRLRLKLTLLSKIIISWDNSTPYVHPYHQWFNHVVTCNKQKYEKNEVGKGYTVVESFRVSNGIWTYFWHSKHSFKKAVYRGYICYKVYTNLKNLSILIFSIILTLIFASVGIQSSLMSCNRYWRIKHPTYDINAVTNRTSPGNVTPDSFRFTTVADHLKSEFNFSNMNE